MTNKYGTYLYHYIVHRRTLYLRHTNNIAQYLFPAASLLTVLLLEWG